MSDIYEEAARWPAAYIGIDPPNSVAVLGDKELLALWSIRKQSKPEVLDAFIRKCVLDASAHYDIKAATIEGCGRNYGKALRFDTLWHIGFNAGRWMQALLPHVKPSIMQPSEWRDVIGMRGRRDTVKIMAVNYAKSLFPELAQRWSQKEYLSKAGQERATDEAEAVLLAYVTRHMTRGFAEAML